ncbi:putative bifunctional diguanylate cyclase/phosphodiesterase [Stutzerimonas tarimensis]|uniref:Bifunctional diguanylate cyclase/phosphodiesterase n=1 Tax=Stutzerimonas tarimensis TaxID=1507735 RepID=A0ABV7T4S9_9GAMM
MALDPPVPANEAQRLVRVHDMCLIDDTPDETLDQIVQMVAEHFGVPIALVSIVDRNRQWFRARVGIEASETSRRDSFCAHAINGEHLFQVCDATRDERFRDNPLVIGGPGVRFYAGIPLVTDDGLGLGSLCIIDTEPRPALTEQQVATLKAMARLAMSRISDLRKLNYIDSATGLANRVRLEEDVDDLLEMGHELLVVVVDALSPQFYQDFVKALGYLFDNDLMLSIKQRLEHLLPRESLLYKISATRFAFISQTSRVGEPEPLFNRIIEAFDAPLECDRIPLRTQVGLGVLVLQPGSERRLDWLRSAISAADDARDQGSGWCYYDPRQDDAQQRAFRLLSSLSDAVQASDQLHLVYQPRVHLATGHFTSVEALLRWNHPELGEVGPAEFIPLAEKTALIRPLSLWVLHEAVRQAAEWQAQGMDFRVSVNVSTADMQDAQFTDRMLALFEHYRVPPGVFEVELTESGLMRNLDGVRAQLERIAAIGVEVAIDDFGSGYSNWAYLRELPATTVKLDQSLLRDLMSVKKHQHIVKTMTELACELGYRVVAEGIESETVYELMRQWGCHEGQAFLMARPMTPPDLLAWAQARGSG